MSERSYMPGEKDYDKGKPAEKKESDQGDAQEEKEKTNQAHESEGSPLGRVTVYKNWFLPTPKQAPVQNNVIYPKRSGNTVVFFKSSKEVFEALDKAIRTAKKSVDIISMGIDTDIRLTRGHEYRKVMRYSKVYPAAVDTKVAEALWVKENSPFREQIASPDPNSSVFSDLVTRRAVVEKAIVVRMIIGVPRNFTPGNTFHDPLHLWWRSKTLPEYKGRIQFALREMDGEFSGDIFPHPRLEDQSGLTPKERAELENNRFGDFLARLGVSFSKTLYGTVFTHHQKLYLIDIEDKNATGFVIGSNLNEDYWDDNEHLAENMKRYPYRAWRDVGLEVKGPVLYDIAQSFKETWSLMETQEVLPFSLYLDARNAQANGVQLGHDRSSRFNFPMTPPYSKENPSWGAKLPGSPEFYSPHSDANDKHVEAQFTRTFVQKGAPRDESLRQVLYRAVHNVLPGGIIYIENQYFRDMELMDHLKEVGEKYSYLEFDDRPKVIIVTNDPRLNEQEAKVAVGPTFEACKRLEQCGLPYHICKLETKDWPQYMYAGARYDK